jgi:acetoacetyl-CoA synthetase
MANDRAAIWTPSADDLKRSSMAKFRDEVNQKYGLSLNTYPELHAWSVNPSTAEDFCITLFEFLHMGATVQPSRAFENVRIPLPSLSFIPK